LSSAAARPAVVSTAIKVKTFSDVFFIGDLPVSWTVKELSGGRLLVFQMPGIGGGMACDQ
jgi:hypothetical protein